MTRTRLWTGAAIVLAASGAGAAVDENLRRHAIRYAGLIERAHEVLADHIRRRSSAATSWTGAAVPGAPTGWQAQWTELGLRARYCDGVLAVYMGAAAPKGVGAHHRDIQMAPRLYLGASDRGLTQPPLHWLDGRRVEGEAIGTVALPACMESVYTEALPRGRAALVATVPDPWLARRTRERYETRDIACGSGRHGDGVRERRLVTREQNGRGDWTGDAVYGPWEVLVDTCRDDYVYHLTRTEECTWHQGEPFNRQMSGVRRWRQAMRVSAQGEQAVGTPVLVGSTCWNETADPRPVGDPTTVVRTRKQEQERDCDEGYTGSVWFERTRTTTVTTMPWASDPYVTVGYSPWQEVRNTCELVPPPEPEEPGERPGGGHCGGCGGNPGSGGCNGRY